MVKFGPALHTSNPNRTLTPKKVLPADIPCLTPNSFSDKHRSSRVPCNTQLTSKLTALELDVKKAVVGVGASVAEEGKGETAGSAGKAYLSLEEYKEATAAGAHVPKSAHCLWACCV